MNYTHVVAVPGAPNVIDCIDPTTGRTIYTKETPEQVALRRPGAVLMPVEAFRAALHAAYQTEPEEITEEQWWYLLEVLPPVAWTNRSGAESFKVCERTVDDITACCVRIGGRYFSMQRPITSTHDELAELVLAKFPEARHAPVEAP